LRHSDLREAVLTASSLRFVHFYNSNFIGIRSRGNIFDQVDLKRPLIEEAQLSWIRNAGCVVELENQPTETEWPSWDHFSPRSGGEEFGLIIVMDTGDAYWVGEGRWDFFISHTSADKEKLAIPLQRALEARGQRVRLDDGQINPNDSLTERIRFGIRASLFGIAILSKQFFGRRWTELELGLFQNNPGELGTDELALLTHKRIFLVLHGMTIDDVMKLRPELGDRYLLSASFGPDRIAEKLVAAIRTAPRLERSD
jgi:hypothetical protein